MTDRGPKFHHWAVLCPYPWSKYQSYWLCIAFPSTPIGVGRLRILGGQGGGGPNSQQEHDIVLTSMGHSHVPTRSLVNQWEIITFLILKSDHIENSRIDLKGIILQVPSNQIKVTFIIILPFNLVHLWFFLFHIEIEENVGGLLEGGGGGGGGGPKNMLDPLSNYWWMIWNLHPFQQYFSHTKIMKSCVQWNSLWLKTFNQQASNLELLRPFQQYFSHIRTMGRW